MRANLLIMILLLASVRARCLAGTDSECRPMVSPSHSALAVEHYLPDPLLKRVWVIIIDCRHPNWPPREVLATPTSMEINSAWSTASPIVKAGSRVELWSEGSARIRLTGVALEAAILGQKVRVQAGLGVSPLCGIVRGAHSVELIHNEKVCRE